MTRRTALVGTVGAAMAWLPMAAHASGRVPVRPATQQLESYPACLAALEGFHDADLRRVAPRKVEANGDMLEVSLDTKGVERAGATSARYEATIWFHHGRLRADLNRTETSHTFEHRIHACDGGLMRTSGENGYTLSTFASPDPSGQRR